MSTDNLWVDDKDSLTKLVAEYEADPDKVVEAFDDVSGPEYVQHSDVAYALRWLVARDKFPAREDYVDVANCRRERWCFGKPVIVTDEKGKPKYEYPERHNLPSALLHGWTEDSSVKSAVLWLAFALREVKKVLEIGPTVFPTLTPPKEETAANTADVPVPTNLNWGLT